MSGGTKQQFKQFSITCAEDACIALGTLISGVSVNLEKYKAYASEAEALLECINQEYVPAKEYDDVNDKLLYRQREMLKLTADHQSSSFSYIDLRKILEKNQYIPLPQQSDRSFKIQRCRSKYRTYRWEIQSGINRLEKERSHLLTKHKNTYVLNSASERKCSFSRMRFLTGTSVPFDPA